jgi:hypothetical protein
MRRGVLVAVVMVPNPCGLLDLEAAGSKVSQLVLKSTGSQTVQNSFADTITRAVLI